MFNSTKMDGNSGVESEIKGRTHDLCEAPSSTKGEKLAEEFFNHLLSFDDKLQNEVFAHLKILILTYKQDMVAEAERLLKAREQSLESFRDVL